MERRLSGEGTSSVFLVLLFQGRAGRESSWGALEQWFSESCKLAHGILPVKFHDSPFTRSVQKWADGWSVPPCSFLISLWHLQFLVIKWSQKKKKVQAYGSYFQLSKSVLSGTVWELLSGTFRKHSSLGTSREQASGVFLTTNLGIVCCQRQFLIDSLWAGSSSNTVV